MCFLKTYFTIQKLFLMVTQDRFQVQSYLFPVDSDEFMKNILFKTEIVNCEKVNLHSNRRVTY